MGCKISFHGPYVVQALSTLMSQEESFLFFYCFQDLLYQSVQNAQ